MYAGPEAKKDAFGRNQEQRKQAARELRRRILDKIQADPDGIWQDLLDDIEGKG